MAIKHFDPAIPVLIVTDAEHSIGAQAFQYGAFAYVPKPFNIAYIDHLVAGAVAQR